jgi:peptide/nickel transport system substrate-binding protein
VLAGASGDPAVATARAALRQAAGSTLTVAVEGTPSDLDPHWAADALSSLAVLGIYEGLIALDGASTDTFVGLLAESWEPNEDESVWTFTLREGVTFHDGTPCDAEAVRLSFERYMTAGYGSGPDWTRFVPSPEAITAPDPRTVVFDLGRPQPLFLAAAAASYGPFVVNAEFLRTVEEDGDWGRNWAMLDATGTGTGPYKLAEFLPGELLRLEKNPDWWGGPDAPAFDEVVLRVVVENATRRQLLESGEVDLTNALTADDFDALKENPGMVVLSEPSTRVDYFQLNTAGPLNAPEARQAMSWAFPYDEVIEGVYQGYAVQPAGFVPESMRGFAPETFRYTTDLEKARELFAAAGVAEGTTLELAIRPGDENVTLAAQLFQANLAELGITLEISEIEASSYVGLLYGDAAPEERPPVFWWAWWPPYNDAWSHLNALVGCEMTGAAGGANFTGYCNEAVQEALDAALATDDEAEYTRLLAEIQQTISADDPAAVYYANPLQTVAYRAGLEGIVLNPINVETFYFQSIRPTE